MARAMTHGYAGAGGAAAAAKLAYVPADHEPVLPAELVEVLDPLRHRFEAALTLASGITPDNAEAYMADVDGFLVATGINKDGDFYNIEPAKLARLLKLTRDHGART